MRCGSLRCHQPGLFLKSPVLAKDGGTTPKEFLTEHAEWPLQNLGIERERLNKITEAVIGAAIQVHRTLGPGLLESAYKSCLTYELAKKGFAVEQEKPVPLVYEDVKLECGYRMDLPVERSVVVEVKSVKALAPIHDAQTLS